MPIPDCIVLVKEMTDRLSENEEFRSMLSDGASHNEIMDRLVETLSPEDRETANLAFAELPRATIQMIIRSWASATKAGKRFSLESVAPVDRDAFVERRRVRLMLDYDDDGITMYLCHVAGTHADWYVPLQPAETAR